MLEEQECIKSVISGNRNAYSEIVLSYQSMVYRVCLKMTSDQSAAEDLAQEVFIKAYHALSSYREEAQFSTWLYQITVRKCLDWRRSKARVSNQQSLSSLKDPDIYTIEWQTPENVLLDKEKNGEIHRIVETLNEPYRTVVKLYYFEQCSYQEISAHTESPVKTVESQLYRARKMIKQRGGSLL